MSKFGSRGIRSKLSPPNLTLFPYDIPQAEPLRSIAERLSSGGFWGGQDLAEMLARHKTGAQTVSEPADGDVSAGKNTYTYDAHTYHTKVPPQGIAEVVSRYLPAGAGLILDPFAGSGMTGVAARILGHDVILNELSPAASFIADRFTSVLDPDKLLGGVQEICRNLAHIRQSLYSTTCRECSRPVEMLYAVWSYRAACPCCGADFLVWDACRRYGKTVREHKILKEFPCPSCSSTVKKSQLARRMPEPVMLGYKCCRPRIQEHPLVDGDLNRIRDAEAGLIPASWYPRADLPDGANLNQPKRHGISSVGDFYTKRNLTALSHIWREANRVQEDQLAGFLGFVFTSLYQRVSKLSEYRFWGGSGNTARFNVPHVFNEANPFVTFERKARSIADHLASTARGYSGAKMVRTGSATDLSFIPDNSIDFIFTDPPFGANINYSEMNILWESWLGQFTDASEEAIISRPQKKGLDQYQELMTRSLRECYRVLRSGNWMVLVFMVSSEPVWGAIKSAILNSGFSLERVDIFDKKHGTFKHHVSVNTAGCDLMIHCRKQQGSRPAAPPPVVETEVEVAEFLGRLREVPRVTYAHVAREPEVDFRRLYSLFVARGMVGSGGALPDFSDFRRVAACLLGDSRGGDEQT